jgi:transcriptional regulator with XRE-family HTH domain
MKQGVLPRRLRMLRADLGLTLREVTERTGVAKETLSDIERGLRHPHDTTLAKLARGYNVSLESLLDLKGEDMAASMAASLEEGYASVLAKSQAPPVDSEHPSERSLSYIDAWTNFMDELSGDVEEWTHAKTREAGVLDPADLPEEEFLPFVREAIPFVRAHNRVFRAVLGPDGFESLLKADVESLLKAEVRDAGRKDRAIEHLKRFERAFNRISRAMLAIATDRATQRLDRIVREGQEVPADVVSLFSGVRRAA